MRKHLASVRFAWVLLATTLILIWLVVNLGKGKTINLSLTRPGTTILLAESYTVRSIPSKNSLFPRVGILLRKARLKGNADDNGSDETYAFVTSDERLGFILETAGQLGEQSFLPISIEIYKKDGEVYRKLDTVQISVLDSK